MKRKTLIRVNIIIALLAAALWFVPYPRGVSETWDAVAFSDGEAIGTTRITADLNTNYYLFRRSETSGTLTIETADEPVVFECYNVHGLPDIDENDEWHIAAYMYYGHRYNSFIHRSEFRNFYLLPDKEMIVVTGETDYCYIGFNGTYEDAAAAFTELTDVISLESFGFTENPFE